MQEKTGSTSLIGISIVSIPVSDQSAAKRFYTDVLGFDVLRDDPMGPDQRWVQLGIDGTDVSITLVHWFEEMPPGSVQGLVLASGKIDEDHRILRDRGLEMSDIDDAPWGRFATFRDLDGNGWVLQEAAHG